MRKEEPIECGICGDGIIKEPYPQAPKEGIIRHLSTSKVSEMSGTDPIKRDARSAWALKVGFCDDCVDQYDIKNDSDLDNILPKVALSRVAKLPNQND